MDLVRYTCCLAAALVLAPMVALAEEGAGEAEGSEVEAEATEAPPLSDGEIRAREHFGRGVRHMRAARWAEAEREFRACYESFPTQAGLFNLGSAVLAQDRPVEALALFDRYLEEFRDRASSDQVAEVQRMRRRALAELCRVTVDASPEGARIVVDGGAVGVAPLDEPLLLTAGEHRFAASLEGYEDREVTRRLDGGCGGEAVAISLRPSRRRGDGGTLLLSVPRAGDEGPRRGLAVAGWVTLALAGASAVGASITGGLALSLHSEFTQIGLGESEEWGPIQHEGRALALTTDILIGVASAAAAICIPLLVYGHRAPEPAGTEEDEE